MRASLLAGAMVGLSLAVSTTRADAQALKLSFKDARLSEIAKELERQSGYDFHLAPGREVEDAKHDFSCDGKPLAPVLRELSSLFHCEFLSLDTSGFYAVTPKPVPGGLEAQVGAYRLRVDPPQPTDDPGVMQLTLIFGADNDEQMEAIAGLAGGLRVRDNFGRSLLGRSTASLLTTSAIRVKQSEYWHRLQLGLSDTRSVRVRSVKGSLVLFRKVTPLRLEFPLNAPDQRIEQSDHGVTTRVENVVEKNGQLTADSGVTWPERLTLAGRGISRTPLPYLVDEKGRVYRDFAPRLTRSKNVGGELVSQQHLRFDGLEAKPAKLVYELFAKELPEITLPFSLGNLPLPPPAGRARPENRFFYDKDGGTLTLQVVDRDGRPAEGEVSLGISQQVGQTWSATRWLDVVTDAQARVSIPHFRPGTYRIVRVYRPDPSAVPLIQDRAPVAVTVKAGEESSLPVLKLPVTAPVD